MKKEVKREKRRLVKAYWSSVTAMCSLVLMGPPAFAASGGTIWDRFSNIMQDVYGQLVVRMVSRNQRAVDEATSWLKRIVITWIVLNSLGFIVAYLQPLIAGGQYTGG